MLFNYGHFPFFFLFLLEDEKEYMRRMDGGMEGGRRRVLNFSKSL